LTYQTRDYKHIGKRHDFGPRTRQDVQCPFCGVWVETYVWSRYGSGKKCECGAILGGWTASKEVKEGED
jgi:hypothetical protein